MKIRFGRAVAGTMAIAAATLMASVGTASADIPPGINWDHVYSGSGARVYVEEHGDIISVCDAAKNGHRAVVEVRDVQVWPNDYKMSVTSGYGTCKTHRASHGAKYNLAEHGIDLYFDGNGGYGFSEERYFYNNH